MDVDAVLEVVPFLLRALGAVFDRAKAPFRERRAARLISEAIQECLLASPDVPKARAKIGTAERLLSPNEPWELGRAKGLLQRVDGFRGRPRKATRRKAARKKARRKKA